MSDHRDRSSRRGFLRVAGAVATLGIAGCSGGGGTGTDSDGNGDAGGGDGPDGVSGTPSPGDGTPSPGDGTPSPGDGTPGTANLDSLTPWWTSHADPERTRSTPDPVPGSLERAGTFELSSPDTLMTHPLVTTEGLFVFRDEYVARYDLASRERAFERSVRPSWTFVRDGTVVVAGSNLLGLNASTGEREWITSVEFGEAYAVVPVPGGIAVTGDSFTGSPLRVLDVPGGEERWSKSGDLGDTNSTYDVNPAAGVKRAGGGRAVSGRRMAPVVHTESGTVFIGMGPRVMAFDTQTGDRKWEFTPDGSQQPRPVPFAVRGGRVYVRGAGDLLALDRADGGVHWKRSASDGTQNPFGGEFAHAVDDTALYFWSSAGEVRALSVEDGSDLWSTAFSGNVFNVSSAVAGDGVVYTTGNGVRILSKSTGELKLSTDVKEPGAGAVVPAGGRIYTFTYIGESTNNPVITVYGSP